MRYYFHVKSRTEFVADVEGTEFATQQAASDEGYLVARELVGTQLIDGKAVDWTSSIVVRDGMDLAIVTISFLEAVGLPQGVISLV